MSSTRSAPSLDPAILVIFGITGDLAQRKLLPALYHLVKDNLLHEHTVIVGLTRRQFDIDQLLSQVELCVNETDGLCDPAVVQKLKSKITLAQLDISTEPAYPELLKLLNSIEEEHSLCMNRLFYLAIPPQVSASIIKNFGKYGLNMGCQHNRAESRLLIEKPFGYDLESANELIEIMGQIFTENQIFRIDHYLAKETVQNILTFRFNNIFELLWNRNHISYIVITAAETLGVEDRARFYEQVGALRDVIQSHLLQLLALVTMDLPESLNSEQIHQAKIELLNNIVPIHPNEIDSKTVRGQYTTYREEVGNPNSITETFAAIVLMIDNERWQNVPIFLRTGKKLAEKLTEIRIVFTPMQDNAPVNELVFRLQPKEGIELELVAKKPSFEYDVQPAKMDFSYQSIFSEGDHPDAYERVIVDAVRGDHTLFATSSEVIAAWKVINDVVRHWTSSADGLVMYESGSWGPKKQQELVEKYHAKWW